MVCLFPVADGRRQVLIVERDAARQQLLTRSVEEAGGAPVVATSDAEAYGELATHADEIALILLGVSSNGLDVFSVRQLQLDAPRIAGIPTVALSDRVLSAIELASLHPTASIVLPVPRHAMHMLIAQHTHPGGDA